MTNETFEPKRFWTYFMFDLNNVKNSFGLSLLVCSMLPLIFFLFGWLISFIDHDPTFVYQFTHNGRISAEVCSFICVSILFGSRVYGKLTDKKGGSAWLMIPASGFEKFISMVSISCILLPFAYTLALSACNLLISFFVSEYGTILPFYCSFDGFDLTKFFIVWALWSEIILTFELGAMVFKKQKTGKTILTIFALSAIMFPVMYIVLFQANDFRFFDYFNDGSLERTELLINIILNVVNMVVITGLLFAVFFRIKTLKH